MRPIDEPALFSARSVLALWTSCACVPAHSGAISQVASPGFTVSARIPVGRAPGSVALADFTRDGRLDIVVASEQSHALTILLGDGAGRFAPASGSPVPSGHSPNDIATADLSGDSILDLAIANHETDYVTVLLGDGQGNFRQAPGSPVRVSVRPHPHGVAAGDFNGDARADLVTDGWETDEIQILLGDGRGTFTAGTALRVGRHPYQRVRSWDIDGDRIADMVTAKPARCEHHGSPGRRSRRVPGSAWLTLCVQSISHGRGMR